MNQNDHLTEEDKKVLLDHDYDGIQEFDYPLPSWWTASFVLCCLFAIPYMIYYMGMGGPSIAQEQEMDMVQLNKVRTAYAVKMAKFDEGAYSAFDNEEGAKLGAVVYEDNCLSCHEENGKGDIGPNLTDAYWMHAKGTKETIYEVVLNGREDKGMPTWKEDLTKDEILQVVKYLMVIKDTNVADGKEPQGELIK